jgi:uncharacterized protein
LSNHNQHGNLNNYLSIALQGKNDWWRYVCGILLSLSSFLILGIIAYVILLLYFSGTSNILDFSTIDIEKFTKTPSIGNFVSSNIPFIFWFAGTVIAVRCIHDRSAWSLISSSGRINWRRLSYGFLVWFGIAMVPSIISLWVSPGLYKFHFDPGEWPLLFGAAIVLTPIQTSCEEIFFRGYVLQGMGLITRQPLVLIISNGLLFLIPHLGNPEIASGIIWVSLQYFSMGVFLAFITLKDNRLELALGVHFANNFSHIFFTTTDSALGAPALWMTQPSPAVFMDIVFSLVYMAIAYYLFFNLKIKKTT